MRQNRKLESDYPPPHARPGTLGALVDRFERMVYGTRPAAGKFGRRSSEDSGLDWPFLEDVVTLAGRIEWWFAGSEPTSLPEKPPPKPRPRPAAPIEPDQDQPPLPEYLPADLPLEIIIGPEPQIVIEDRVEGEAR